MPHPPAHLVESTEDHLIGTWENMLLLVWKNETTPAALGGVRKAHARLEAAYPAEIFILTVVEDGAPMPPSATRDAMANLLKSFAGSVALSAVVHEGGGFRAAAVRSVVTGVSLLARLPFPHKVFATVPEAAHFFPPNAARKLPWTSKDLISAVAEFRERDGQSVEPS